MFSVLLLLWYKLQLSVSIVNGRSSSSFSFILPVYRNLKSLTYFFLGADFCEQVADLITVGIYSLYSSLASLTLSSSLVLGFIKRFWSLMRKRAYISSSFELILGEGASKDNCC
jgi:hypothetical protein